MSKQRKRLALALAIVFALNIFIIGMAQSAAAELYKKGSSGATVTEIQTRLKEWGYYSGEVTASTAARPRPPCAIFKAPTGLTPMGRWAI